MLNNIISKQAMEIYNQIILDLPFPVDTVDLVSVSFGSDEPKVESVQAETVDDNLVISSRVRSTTPMKILLEITLLAGRKISCTFNVFKFEGDLEFCISSSETATLLSMTFSELPEITMDIDCEIKSFSSVLEMVVHRIKVICSKMFVSPNRYNLVLDKKSKGAICSCRGGLLHGIKAGTLSVKLKHIISERLDDDDFGFYYCSLIHDDDRYVTTYQPLVGNLVTLNELFLFRHEGPLHNSLIIRLYYRRGGVSKDQEVGFAVIKFDRILFNKLNTLEIPFIKSGKEIQVSISVEIFRHTTPLFKPTKFLNHFTSFSDSGILFGKEDSSEFDKKTEKTHHTRSNSSRNSGSRRINGGN